MSKYKIIVADDQTLMRDGLKTILDLEDDMEVIGLAENGEEAYNLVKELTPDIVLMDVQMPQMSGVESVRLIKRDFPHVIVIMLTTFDDEEYIIETLASGAVGFLLKDMPGDRLINAVRDAAKGQMMLPSAVAIKLATRLSIDRNIYDMKGKRLSNSTMSISMEEFSDREKEIIYYMIEGLNNKQIAEKIFIGEGTVRNYVSNIYNKIGVNDRTNAIIYLSKVLKIN